MDPAVAIWMAAGAAEAPEFSVTNAGDLPSAFDVSGLAAASVGAAGAALASYVEAATGRRPAVSVDRRLASLWFKTSLRPLGWSLPPNWDAVAGDYRTADGWIRLHTNAPHHRRAALAVLAVAAERTAVARAVAGWRADALEDAVLAAGGCAATMRSAEDWAVHPQGIALAAEPLVHLAHHDAEVRPGRVDPGRPLAGLRVLDLTRVLAGPTATRFLAGFGAEVLRLDPPFWSEPALEPEMTLGKSCAAIDLREPAQLAHFKHLLAGADILVHGYRPGALDRFGLGDGARRQLNPGLIDVRLDAYGWTGPWAGRRGFDSLVQMSAGIAEAGMGWAGADRPTPLPAQALDMATGYILATTALLALVRRLRTGAGSTARVSLARTALLLAPAPAQTPLLPLDDADFTPQPEPTAWGPALRLRPPVEIDGVKLRWDVPAGPLRTGAANWAP